MSANSQTKRFHQVLLFKLDIAETQVILCRISILLSSEFNLFTEYNLMLFVV